MSSGRVDPEVLAMQEPWCHGTWKGTALVRAILQEAVTDDDWEMRNGRRLYKVQKIQIFPERDKVFLAGSVCRSICSLVYNSTCKTRCHRFNAFHATHIRCAGRTVARPAFTV